MAWSNESAGRWRKLEIMRMPYLRLTCQRYVHWIVGFHLVLVAWQCGAVEVNPSDREASRQFYWSQYVAQSSAAIDWNGNAATCDPGTTSAAFRGEIQQQINYFRAMAGVPAEVTLVDHYSRAAQEAALMMSVNGALSHFPPAEWTCYTPDGADVAGKSNLFLGVNGPEAIAGYIRDPGANNEAVGHRRWLLYPQTQQMGSGDVPAQGGNLPSNALRVFDDDHLFDPRPATRDGFIAWPPPGYVPYQVTYPRWSFSLGDADFSQASVLMSTAAGAIPTSVAPVANGYGENTIVWTFPGAPGDWDSWPQPAADTSYAVTVQNVFVAGQPTDYSYEVIVFDPAISGRLAGDFDQDGVLTAADIDELSRAIRQGTNQPSYDLDSNGAIDSADRNFWIWNLRRTTFGDADFSGRFTSEDIVAVFQAGEYEDAVPVNSGWAEGDWNGDGDFTSGDIVEALTWGCFEGACAAPRAATSVRAVPEPSTLALLLLALITVYARNVRACRVPTNL
jgi:hypothetical protein